jgi:hypothetical protein
VGETRRLTFCQTNLHERGAIEYRPRERGDAHRRAIQASDART